MVAAALLCASAAAAQEAPDLVFHGGVVVTMSDDLTRAEAVAVRGGNIVAVGSSSELLELAGTGASTIDLGGRTLMPGFVDAHSHLFNDAAGQELSLEEAQQMALENGITAFGNMFSDELFVEEMTSFATAYALDRETEVGSIEVGKLGQIW